MSPRCSAVNGVPGPWANVLSARNRTRKYVAIMETIGGLLYSLFKHTEDTSEKALLFFFRFLRWFGGRGRISGRDFRLAGIRLGQMQLSRQGATLWDRRLRGPSGP